ncbi:hypothetical protein BGZ99_005620 [Dissophora globulifera]|uniref:Non-homologous end-joining factor 1 n=1 Tax=Dissophora globulifera TaxID=979702 RepID=A0A9P6REC7_9FUNG|nr:hypothetical protein BGZ99_005620 [Dissophora globulifera]
MQPLSRKDNDLLRNQEWRPLFDPTSSPSNKQTLTSAHPNNLLSFPSEDQLPAVYAQDMFLVKSYFSESDKYYLLLVTNLKQCWWEKLEIEDIRERSKRIRSFAYEEDSQLEALLLSLSSIFSSTDHHTDPSAAPAFDQRRIEKHNGKLLSPTSDSDDPATDKALLSNRHTSASKRKNTHGENSRLRNFLEDSDNEDEQDPAAAADEMDDESRRSKMKVDGMSVMYEHLLLPLISLTNAYRKQIKGWEGTIKAKEHEVIEALEMLEQSGVGYHNRRKATERYDKAQAEARLQKDIEQSLRPQVSEPKELFSDTKVLALCSIVSRNADDQGMSPNFTPPSSLNSEVRSSQDPSSSQTVRDQSSSLSVRRGGADGTSASFPTDSAAGAEVTEHGPSGNKAAKQAEELGRRRVLQEQLDKEKADKERARKKKKLF